MKTAGFCSDIFCKNETERSGSFAALEEHLCSVLCRASIMLALLAEKRGSESKVNAYIRPAFEVSLRWSSTWGLVQRRGFRMQPADGLFSALQPAKLKHL